MEKLVMSKNHSVILSLIPMVMLVILSFARDFVKESHQPKVSNPQVEKEITSKLNQLSHEKK